MIRRFSQWLFVGAVATFAAAIIAPPAWADRPLKVVATLSTFADLVKQIGGENVEVSSVASPRFNPHFIEPRPSDVLKVKRADLFVHAGLDLELWRGPLLDAAGNAEIFPGGEGELDLSRGIPLLEVPDRPLSRLMGDIHLYGNPHYWTNPENARIMAQAICDKLCQIDPTRQDDYRRRLRDFLSRLDQNISHWKNQTAAIQGKEVIAYHNEWPYLAQFASVKIEQFLEPKPGIPPGPKHLGFLEGYMKAHGIKVIIQPTFYTQNYSQALAKRAGAKVVILAQGVGELPQAKDYFAMMDYNVQQLTEALGGVDG